MIEQITTIHGDKVYHVHEIQFFHFVCEMFRSKIEMKTENKTISLKPNHTRKHIISLVYEKLILRPSDHTQSKIFLLSCASRDFAMPLFILPLARALPLTLLQSMSLSPSDTPLFFVSLENIFAQRQIPKI